MERYKYIFCILVYRNVEDIKECIDSIMDKVENCKIVIVNSFYDNESKNEFEKIAHKKPL
jgi:GT2 family glycosyltransferase